MQSVQHQMPSECRGRGRAFCAIVVPQSPVCHDWRNLILLFAVVDLIAPGVELAQLHARRQDSGLSCLGAP